MRLPFGLEIRKAAPPGSSSVDSRGGWWPLVREPFAGAWQRNQEWTPDTVLAYHAVYACITLIASDVGKLRPKLVEQDDDGIWSETERPAFSPVLRQPNRYQNHIQFKEWWITSKLIRGNTYALKERDNRNVVRALYLLDPSRVKVLVAPDGSAFYELSADNLSGIRDPITVPASEIIHDRMNCLFHPLVGVSPIFACGASANIGLQIQTNSTAFFGNGSNPSGILTAPTEISKDDAERLQEHWNKHYAGSRSGGVAVLGSGLTFEAMRMTAVDSQLIQQLHWTAEVVCSTFHVPPFKVGVGQMPTYQNGEILDGFYYSNCLQSHIESWEAVMDEGLGLTESKDGKTLGVELDLDGLLRMDTATQYKTLGDGISAGLIAPNEGRKKIDLKPVPGGETPYLQQQNYSLDALNKRDQAAPAPSDTTPAREPAPAPASDNERVAAGERAMLALRVSKGLRLAA